MVTIRVNERPGKCRWCGCTDENGCPDGCWWANRQHTLCSTCQPLDALLRTVHGRKALAELVDEALADLSHAQRRA